MFYGWDYADLSDGLFVGGVPKGFEHKLSPRYEVVERE